MFRLKTIFVVSLGLLVFSTVIIEVAFDMFLETPLSVSEEDIIFEIKAGESVKSIAERLEKQEIVSSSIGILLYSRIYGLDSQIKRGEYN